MNRLGELRESDSVKAAYVMNQGEKLVKSAERGDIDSVRWIVGTTKKVT